MGQYKLIQCHTHNDSHKIIGKWAPIGRKEPLQGAPTRNSPHPSRPRAGHFCSVNFPKRRPPRAPNWQFRGIRARRLNTMSTFCCTLARFNTVWLHLSRISASFVLIFPNRRLGLQFEREIVRTVCTVTFSVKKSLTVHFSKGD